ncbi:hypothetical protein A8B78_02930 [Jannaschia sp. EhC01]|nr:hypothetical protein A8B78_02930 [Jannaschia sp. EhC01]
MIRPATQDDVVAIADISRLARTTAMPWLPVLHSIEGDRKFFGTRVLPQDDVVVAETDGVIAGFMARHGNWIEHLYIAPAHQRQGLGAAFIARAQLQVPYLQLWVFARNHAAQAFYAAHGFVEVERTDGQNNEEKTPDIRMEWRAPS